jgi:hypothetical protein
VTFAAAAAERALQAALAEAHAAVEELRLRLNDAEAEASHQRATADDLRSALAALTLEYHGVCAQLRAADEAKRNRGAALDDARAATLASEAERATLQSLLDVLVTSCRIEKAFLFDVVSKIYVATDSSPVDMQSYELCADMIDAVSDVSSIYGGEEGAGFTAPESNCVITLSNRTAIYLREANRSLALVCIVSESVLTQQGLLEYNFGCFREALAELFRVPV